MSCLMPQAAQRECAVSIFGEVQNLTGHCPEQPALGDLLEQGGWAR